MISIKVYPKNKKFFIRLKAFCQEIMDILKDLRITPIAFGSLAYFGYTMDKDSAVKDIDFLIPGDSFEKVMEILAKKGIKHQYNAEWNDLRIFKGDLRIELDTIEGIYKDKKPRGLKDFDFGGLIIKVISLEDLIKRYKEGLEAKDKPEEHRKKLIVLKKLKK